MFFNHQFSCLVYSNITVISLAFRMYPMIYHIWMTYEENIKRFSNIPIILRIVHLILILLNKRIGQQLMCSVFNQLSPAICGIFEFTTINMKHTDISISLICQIYQIFVYVYVFSILFNSKSKLCICIPVIIDKAIHNSNSLSLLSHQTRFKDCQKCVFSMVCVI